MAKSRKTLIEEANQQTYLLASFFKMKTTGSAVVDAAANRSVADLLPAFPHPNCQTRFIPERQPWVRRRIERGYGGDLKENDKS